tara:strand:- start:2218 stop:2817 length:600 start_codon:yes stop_codon:yes gene_type:complete
MDGILVFQKANSHPLAWLLHREHRHVWCAIRDDDRGMWISYDWRQGIPMIRAEAANDFDLAHHYRSQGHTVVKVQVGDQACLSPIVMNNCVGHVKLIMGIKSWAVTPYQLYQHCTKKRCSMFDKIKLCFTIPGFGGGSPAPPPPPPPMPDPPKKTDPAVQQARTDEQRRARQRAGVAGTIKTPMGGVGEATTTKTLLGQ